MANEDGIFDPTITSNEYFEFSPVWSPDGTQIAFLQHRPWEFRIVVLNTENGDERTVVTRRREWLLRSLRQRPVWSPDGRYLAYALYALPSNHNRYLFPPMVTIYLASSTGTDKRDLTSAVSGPAWSPDGKRIAFAKADGDDVALYTMAVDGSAVERVTTIHGWHPPYWYPDPTAERIPDDAWIGTIDWSPDGSMILYSCGVRVCVVTSDGMAIGQSPITSAAEASAAWSPDGRRIAIGLQLRFPQAREHNVLLYTMDPDGTDVRILAAIEGGDWRRLRNYGRVLRRPPANAAGCSTAPAVPEPAKNPGLVHDCEALLQIRDALAGSAELNWSGNTWIFEWDGVVVGGSPLRVQELRLPGRGLIGVIPPALGELSELRYLELDHNFLGGMIPPELGKLNRLEALDLSFNFFSGSIPQELSELADLRFLDFSVNYLHGDIPAWIGRLSQLIYLRFDHNQLTGSIPVEFAQLSRLIELWLQNNRFTGEVPAKLQELRELQYLALWGNELTGCLPSFGHV